MMTGGLFEFRDYHYDGDLDEYRRWWEEALPLMRQRFDIVGVWTDDGEPPRIAGATPMALPLGSANVTWVIRWDDMADREQAWNAMADDAEWQALADRHPGFENYLHMSARFLRPVDG
jgi:hypothetical protein